ncbi:MAG: ABC transporter substrate-binding protein, partial [Bacteroidia bacterium]
MPARFNRASLKYPVIILGIVVLLILIGIAGYRKFSALKHDTYKIGIIINSVEITPEDFEVVKYIITKKLESVNESGGINDHHIEAHYIDDKGSNELLYKLVEESIGDTNMLAYIGCKSSSRAQAIAPLLAKHNTALIGGYSLTPLVEKYPNMYSGEIGIREVSVMLQNLLKTKATKGAFIGKTGDAYSEALLHEMDLLAEKNPAFKVTFRTRFPLAYKFNKNQLDAIADSLKQNADFLLLSTEQESTNFLLDELWKRGVRMPVFCGLADISQINKNSGFYNSAQLYDINPVGIPGVLNMRLQEQLSQYKNHLKQSSNIAFQLGFGGRHADMIGLIAEASHDQSVPDSADIRTKINAGLEKYINGYQIYRGWFADWYFTSDRSFAGEALLSWKPKKFNDPVLAPLQFHRTDSGLQTKADMPVLYTSIDMDNISQVNDNEGTFSATFYLEINSAKNLTIKDINFTNATRNKINQEPLLESKLIQSNKDSLPDMFYNYLYKISGIFLFDPDLKDYPFDEQKFPVTLQSSNTLLPFLVQPPDQDLRDTIFKSEGWIYKNNYVGYAQDIIRSDQHFSSLQKNIPYYKFSFVYELKRARIDFTLKTLVPLLAILVISYFSVYIPHREFEALAGIQ